MFVNKWLSVLLISAWFPYFVRRNANSEKFLPLAEETYDVRRESVSPPRYRHLVNKVKFFANIGDVFWSFLFGNVSFKCARACADLEKDRKIVHAKKSRTVPSLGAVALVTWKHTSIPCSSGVKHLAGTKRSEWCTGWKRTRRPRKAHETRKICYRKTMI